MAARSVPRTAVRNPGDPISSTQWTTGVGYLNDFMTFPPIFRGRCTTAPVATTGVPLAMPLDTSDFDFDAGHSNVTNNSRYTCQVPGWYQVEGYVAFTNGGSNGRVIAYVYKNGSPVAGSSQSTARVIDFQSVVCSTLVQLAAGDYVEIFGRQDTGANVAVTSGVDLAPCMNLFWVHA